MKEAHPALLRLKPGRDKSLMRGHPWIFNGAVARLDGAAAPGATVAVVDSAGAFLAWAAYSPHSQICARVWSCAEADAVGPDLFRKRLAAAVLRRRDVVPSDALRLVHGEADGLPGVIIDRYADCLVGQFLTAGAEHHKALLAELACEVFGSMRLYERSDADVRALEGLESAVGPLVGAPPAAPVIIVENGLRYAVDVVGGQKTGFYLDQRDNRARVAQLATGAVLNCFCYTGGFSLAALKAGASHVTSIDSSGPALAMARENQAMNGFADARCTWLDADVFTALRTLRNDARQFDTIILDPPKFAPTAAHAEKAARAYKDINLLALKLLRPGGLLFTFSCSGGVSAELFQKIVAGAAADANTPAHVVARLQAAPDHPVLMSFPEGDYLKGLLLRRLDGALRG